MRTIKCYTDGAISYKNNNMGAIGGIILFDSGNIEKFNILVKESSVYGNELYAVGYMSHYIRSLVLDPESSIDPSTEPVHVEMYIDNQSVAKGLTVYKDKWIKNGFMTSGTVEAPKPIKHAKLWKTIFRNIRRYEFRGLTYSFHWLTSHTDVKEISDVPSVDDPKFNYYMNNQVDKLTRGTLTGYLETHDVNDDDPDVLSYTKAVRWLTSHSF